MTKVHVFDPAMCCSTGICGPSIDPQLARFAADLDWLSSQGVTVERFNLSQQPGAFAGDADVRRALESLGEAGLPLLKVNDEVKSSGEYPSREMLAAWAGIDGQAPGLFTEAVEELVALGAAVASNCEPCFRFHYDKARKLGVSQADMQRAVTVALKVKAAPSNAMLELTQRYLKQDWEDVAKAPVIPSSEIPAAASAGCCGPSASSETSTPAKSCC